MKNLSDTLEVSPPFSLAFTAGTLTYFQGRVGADCFENGVYRRALEMNGRIVLLSVQDVGSVNAPRLELTVSAENLVRSEALRAMDTCRHMLAIGVNLSPFYDQVADDPILRAAVKTLRGLHPPRLPTVFEGLVFAVCGQQVSSIVARQIRTLIVEKYGDSLNADGVVYHSFPSPRRLLDAGLEGLLAMKLSKRKADYILGIASKAVEGELEMETFAALPDEQIVVHLDTLRGVGSWSAEWVLLRAIGRQDVFPAGDLALRRILSERYYSGKEVSESEARRFATRWMPFRGLATAYLFAAERLRSKRARIEETSRTGTNPKLGARLHS